MHRDPSEAQRQECKAGNIEVLSVWSRVKNLGSFVYRFNESSGKRPFLDILNL